MKNLFAQLLTLCLSLAAHALPIQVDPAGAPLAGTFAVEWETAANFENWTTSQTTAATVSAGNLTGTSSGADPQVIFANFSSGPDLDLGFNDYLETRIQLPASYLGDIQIFYGTTSTTGFDAARVLTIPSAMIPKDGAFHIYRIDVGPEPWWRGTLRDLRIDPVATSGQCICHRLPPRRRSARRCLSAEHHRPAGHRLRAFVETFPLHLGCQPRHHQRHQHYRSPAAACATPRRPGRPT